MNVYICQISEFMIKETSVAKNILITGGTSGLGLELVNSFLSQNYNVYTTGRDLKDVRFHDERFHFIKVDFSELRQISEVMHQLNEQEISFDIIINNAGILSPPAYTKTQNGFEYTFQINFLAHMLLDELIIKNKNINDLLEIVSVSSPVYKFYRPGFKIKDDKDYRSFRAYAESKFYIILIGAYLEKKYPHNNLKFFAFNPAIFRSGISRMQRSWFQRMYAIGAPFMQNPSKVAKALTEIVQLKDIINGAVYKSRNSYKIPDHIDHEAIEGFMKECYEQIESCIR